MSFQSPSPIVRPFIYDGSFRLAVIPCGRFSASRLPASGTTNIFYHRFLFLSVPLCVFFFCLFSVYFFPFVLIKIYLSKGFFSLSAQAGTELIFVDVWRDVEKFELLAGICGHTRIVYQENFSIGIRI